MKSYYLLIILFFTIAVKLNAQSGYIFKSKDTISSAVFIDQGHKMNTKCCVILQNDSLIRYKPNEIYGYSITQGPRYYSKTIRINDSLQTIFLEQIAERPYKLFYLNHGEKRFFIELDNKTLHEFYPDSKKGFVQFDSVLDSVFNECDYIINQKDRVKYTKSSLKLFFERYDKCENKPFPQFRFGATLGYGWFHYKSPITEHEINNLEFGNIGAANFGFFIDQPLYLSTFTLHIDVLYFKQASGYSYQQDGKDLDFVANIHSLLAPVQIRYTLFGKKISPYVNAGVAFAYNFKNENYFINATISDDNTVYIDIDDESYISDFQMGFVAGAGLEFPITKNHSLFTEVKYENLFGSPSKQLNTRYFHLNLGIIF
jgi:opacity protein-like surface antigen